MTMSPRMVQLLNATLDLNGYLYKPSSRILCSTSPRLAMKRIVRSLRHGLTLSKKWCSSGSQAISWPRLKLTQLRIQLVTERVAMLMTFMFFYSMRRTKVVSHNSARKEAETISRSTIGRSNVFSDSGVLTPELDSNNFKRWSQDLCCWRRELFLRYPHLKLNFRCNLIKNWRILTSLALTKSTLQFYAAALTLVSLSLTTKAEITTRCWTT